MECKKKGSVSADGGGLELRAPLQGTSRWQALSAPPGVVLRSTRREAALAQKQMAC
jgi:hypothetical protein